MLQHREYPAFGSQKRFAQGPKSPYSFYDNKNLRIFQRYHIFISQAVRFLHEAGVLLHYEEAALQLSDLYFVNPEWLCRMMAQVITVREVNPYISPQGVS